MKMLFALLLVSLVQNAVAETVLLDFEGGEYIAGSTQYIEDGYQLVAVRLPGAGGTPRFSTSGLSSSQPPANRSKMLGVTNSGANLVLSNLNGSAFDLISIDIARATFFSTFRDTNPFDLTFNGTLADGGTVSQTFNYNGGSSTIGIQNFVFSNFSNLTQVTWLFSSSSVHQFDNIVIKTSDIVNVSAVPAPAAAWLFGSGLLGFAALRRKLKAY